MTGRDGFGALNQAFLGFSGDSCPDDAGAAMLRRFMESNGCMYCTIWSLSDLLILAVGFICQELQHSIRMNNLLDVTLQRCSTVDVEEYRLDLLLQV